MTIEKRMLNNLHRTKNSATYRKTTLSFVFGKIFYVKLSAWGEHFAGSNVQQQESDTETKPEFHNQFKTSLIFFEDSIKDIEVKSCKWVVISYRRRNIYILAFKSPGNELWKRSFSALEKN